MPAFVLWREELLVALKTFCVIKVLCSTANVCIVLMMIISGGLGRDVKCT